MVTDLTNKRKVIGVGFHKTGTTTLCDCLTLLGYKHISCNERAFKYYYSGRFDKILKMMEKYDSFEDWPWPLVYKEAYERFPDARFVLTRRTNETVWFNSLVKHVERGAGIGFKYRKYIYGYENPSEYKMLYINKYLEHNKKVRDFFSDKKDQFLEISWEEGDSWRELCSFLGEPVPDKSLPHSNSYTSASGVPLSKYIKNIYYYFFSPKKKS